MCSIFKLHKALYSLQTKWKFKVTFWLFYVSSVGYFFNIFIYFGEVYFVMGILFLYIRTPNELLYIVVVYSSGLLGYVL